MRGHGTKVHPTGAGFPIVRTACVLWCLVRCSGERSSALCSGKGVVPIPVVCTVPVCDDPRWWDTLGIAAQFVSFQSSGSCSVSILAGWMLEGHNHPWCRRVMGVCMGYAKEG